LLNDAFSFHYLRRGSWHSRQDLIDHIEAAWPEYRAVNYKKDINCLII
jgi:hypothetical protein